MKPIENKGMKVVFAKLITVAVVVAASAAANACAYKISIHGSTLAASEAFRVANRILPDVWCEFYPGAEHELFILANSYENGGREFYAHVVVGARKRGGNEMPAVTFSSHSHIRHDGNHLDAVATATVAAINDMILSRRESMVGQ